MITAKEARELKNYNSQLAEIEKTITQAAKDGYSHVKFIDTEKTPYAAILESLHFKYGFEVKIEKERNSSTYCPNWPVIEITERITTISW